MTRVQHRVLGCLKGVACGDAIGKQSEGLSREEVRRWYPHGLRGFEGTPGEVIPRYAGNSKRKWSIGETTDDTERTLAVARAIVRDGDVRHASVGLELLTCTKCVHPGIKSLWEFHQAGNPARIAEEHDGCGAAVRVAPVGILYRSHRLDEIVAGSRQSSIPTHGGPLALAGAAAAAAAVSAAIDGGTPDDILHLARQAASRAERDRTGSTDAPFAQALHDIHLSLRDVRQLDPTDVAGRYFPDNPLTIVPLAIALAAVLASADEAFLLAANVGGDSDSVASIAGAILGARFPETIDDEWYAVVETVNAHELAAVSEALGARRH